MIKEFEGNLDLRIIERKASDDDIISATKVRNLLIADNLDEVKRFVPETTYAFLISDEGKKVIAALKESDHEHP